MKTTTEIEEIEKERESTGKLRHYYLDANGDFSAKLLKKNRPSMITRCDKCNADGIIEHDCMTLCENHTPKSLIQIEAE